MIVNEGIFYTDANGVELLRRRWTEGVDRLNIPANYYPVTSMISIRDEQTAMTVLNDRAQGGSSIKEGRLELALNRKTAGNDMGGMTLGLDIPGETEVEFFLHFETAKANQSLVSMRDLFAKLLRKSSSIASPL